MKRIVKFVLKLALVAFVIIQFIRPDKNNGGYQDLVFFEEELKPSKEVVGILKANCYDCHSNETKYPWYAEISPVNYWLEDHVEEGKEELNFAEWESYSVKKKDHKLEELIEEVEEGHMPLDEYTWMHDKLSPEDKKSLLQWATLARMQYKSQLEVSMK